MGCFTSIFNRFVGSPCFLIIMMYISGYTEFYFRRSEFKKALIGVCLLIAGIIETVGIIITASLSLASTTSWSTSYPSKLFFLIFAGKSRFDDGADGLGLGVFFVFGIILTILGLIVLGIEYFRKD